MLACYHDDSATRKLCDQATGYPVTRQECSSRYRRIRNATRIRIDVSAHRDASLAEGNRATDKIATAINS